MKVIVLGDVHIGARNDSQVFADYHISFFTEQLFPYMKKHKIKHIIQLGDIFDRRKFVNFVVLNQWKTKVFDYMQAEKITMDVLLGNHDVYFRNTNDVSSPVLLLREYYNINVFVEPTDVTIGTSKFMYIPWINSSNLESTRKRLPHLVISSSRAFRWIKDRSMRTVFRLKTSRSLILYILGTFITAMMMGMFFMLVRHIRSRGSTMNPQRDSTYLARPHWK